MHDLRTIIKLNAPINQRNLAMAKAADIARAARPSPRIPDVDRVVYGAPSA